MNEMIKKLKFNPEKTSLQVNVPENLQKTFKGLKTSAGKAQQIIGFAENVRQLKDIIKEIKTVLEPDTLCWIAYPKGSAKTNTDLSRDKGWESMNELGWEGMSLISIDSVWSAMRFKPSDKIQRQPENQSDQYMSYIDINNRLILKLPDDLNKALKKANLLSRFKEMSYTHQKEYIISFVDAKKEETRSKRLNALIEKLGIR